MFAGRSVRMRWPLEGADELFAVSRSFERSRGKFETKRLFGKSLESRNGVRRVRGPACLSGQARDDDFQLVYARPINQSFTLPGTSR
jgi:hypothetical protein